MVVFDLNHGRRAEPLETAQLAGAVKRQESLSRSVLAQQIQSGSDPRVAPARPAQVDFARQAALLRRAARSAFSRSCRRCREGTMMSATGVVSADRRYVRIAVAPIFSTIGDVQTFTFAGQADPTGTGDWHRHWCGRRCRRAAAAVVAQAASSSLRLRRQQPNQNALLHVHPVGGLRDDHALRAVDHFVGDFFAAMRRQAVQEERVLAALPP